MNILITGGASGLGKGLTHAMVENKNIKTIYITYNKAVQKAIELEAFSKKIISIKCDFTLNEDVNKLCELIPSFDLDILVNNAFTGLEKKHFHKIEPEHFYDSFKNNVMPTVKITQASIKTFRNKKFGKIITILSSYLINKPPIGLSEYTASKSYLLSLSKSWATENSKFNITSNSICPSYMATELNANEDPRVIEIMENSLPLKKILSIEEVAECLSYLVTCTQQVNGQSIVINQGVDL